MSDALMPLSISFTVGLLVLTVAAVFLVDTFAKRDTPAGRIWAFAFLALSVATFSYVAEYSIDAQAWVAGALGNACYVVFFAAFCAGVRRFNQARMRVAVISGGVAAALAAAGAIAANATGIGILRELPLHVGVAALAACTLLATRRAPFARKETVLLSIVLGVAAVFHAAAALVEAVPGLRDLPGVTGVFNPITAALLTVPVAVAGVTTAMVVRAMARMSATRPMLEGEIRVDRFGMLDAPSFDVVLQHLVRRADSVGEQVAVLAMTLADLQEIDTAIGDDAEGRLRTAWRASWLRHIPVAAIPGDIGDGCLAVILPPATLGEANRVGNRVYGRVIDDLAGVEGVVLPVTGFGLAMSGSGSDAQLVAAARQAANRSATGRRAGQVVAVGEDVLTRTAPPTS